MKFKTVLTSILFCLLPALTFGQTFNPNQVWGPIQHLTANSATPSVKGFTQWETTNTIPVVITNFTGAFSGQPLTVICGDSNTSIVSDANLSLNSNFSCSGATGISFSFDGSIWHETGRSNNGIGISVKVNGGSNLPSPVNFQNGPTYCGLVVNALNPNSGNVDFGLSGIQTELCAPTTSVFTDVGAAFGAHLYDFSASTIKIPAAAGFTGSASQTLGINTTTNNLVGFLNSASSIFPYAVTPGSWTNGHCATVSVIAGQIGVADSGVSGCSGSGGGPTISTNGTPNSDQTTLDFDNSNAFNGLTATFTNTSLGHVKLGFTGTLGNAGLTNSATTVNGQTCTLGSTCLLPFQTNGVSNTSQVGINLLTSTANSVGLTVTPVNSSTNGEKFEVTGNSYSGNAATATVAGGLSSTLIVGQGGTGQTSLTAHGVLMGEGSSAIGVSSAGTSGKFFISGGSSADGAYGGGFVDNLTTIIDSEPTYFKGGAPWFDVVAYGAKCDGTTDDTSAFNTAIAAWQAANFTNHGGAVLSIPPGQSGACAINGPSISIASGNNGGFIRWVEDNSLLIKVGTLTCGGCQNIHFEGRSGGTEGLSGASQSDGGTTWESNGNYTPLTITGLSSGNITAQALTFDGFNFAVNGSACSVKLLDQGVNSGVTQIKFSNTTFNQATPGSAGTASICTVPDITADTVGFGLTCENCTLNDGFILNNFGDVHFIGRTATGPQTLLFENTSSGAVFDGDLTFDGSVSSETLVNTPFLTLDSSAGGSIYNVKLSHVSMNDASGTSYLIKNKGTNTNSVWIDQPQINGLIFDPSSTAQGMGAVYCVGGYLGCQFAAAQSGAVSSMVSLPESGRPNYFLGENTNYPAGAFNGGFAGAIKTVSTNYVLTYADNWVNDSGSSNTITVPHAWYDTSGNGGIPNRWSVFNSGSGTINVNCDSGTINGISALTLTTKTGVTVTSDGTNCFANISGATYPGAGIPVSTGSAWGTSLSETDGNIIAGVASAWTKVTALPNGITATTQTASDTSTKVATDAFVSGIITLPSLTTASSLATVGTIGTGVWQGTAIANTYGGTGQNSSGSTGIAQVSGGTWSFSTALANGTTATTQSLGDNTTKAATDAFVIANAGGFTNPMTTLGDVIYGGASGTATRLPGPSANGFYTLGYNVTGATVLAPASFLAGMSARSLTGSTTGLTILYSDNEQSLNHDVTATGVGAITLPTATSLGNANFVTSYCNKSAQTDVITPTTWTINGTATLSVPTNVCYRIHVDGNSSTNWLADANGGTGGGGIAGLTTAFFPEAASAVSIKNGPCNDGVTTAGVITCSEPAVYGAGNIFVLTTVGANQNIDIGSGNGSGALGGTGYVAIGDTSEETQFSSVDGRINKYDSITTSTATGALKIPIQVGYATQTGKTTAISAATLFATGASSAEYRASATVQCTGTSAAATVLISIIYTDTSSTVVTLPSSAAVCTTNTGTGPQDSSLSIVFRAKNGTNIQYSTTIVNTPTYDVSVSVEQLGTN